MGFYRDADIERAASEAEAARAAAVREAGSCTHGATQGYTEKYRPDLAPDRVECLECSEQWDSLTPTTPRAGRCWGDRAHCCSSAS